MKLNLICSQKNSGGAGIPRNIGMKISRAEYITFVDSDDAITPTALEELYPIAKKFEVDVLYCEKYYRVEVGEKFTTDKNFLNTSVGWNANYDFSTEPKLCNSIDERIKDFVTKKFWTACWNLLFNRKFIARENIYFPLLKIGEDEIFVFNSICAAKNLIRIPNIIYVWRRHSDSLSKNPLTGENPVVESIECWGSSIFSGIPVMNEIIDKLEICRTHPEYRHRIFEAFILGKINNILPIYAQIPAWQLEELIRRELEKVADKTALTAFLFSRMNIFNVNLNRQNAMLYQMNTHIQKQNEIIKNLQAEVSRLQQK